MAQTEYQTDSLPRIDRANVAIVMSKWHREYSDKMVARCIEVLTAAGCPRPEVHIMPGSLELPLAARRLAQRDSSLEAIIAFGVVLKGDTYHFEMVTNLCMSGLERVTFEFDIPIINEVLAAYSVDDVRARTGDDDHNKGLEAAVAAIEVIDWRRRHPAAPQR